MENIALDELFAKEVTDNLIQSLWYDWFCSDSSLTNKGKKLFSKAKAISKSPHIDTSKTYVFFKNNCPLYGDAKLYDDFRICDIETGDVLFTFIPRNPYGKAEVYGIINGNDFQRICEADSWRELKKAFLAL